jgi:hypothetical protein
VLHKKYNVNKLRDTQTCFVSHTHAPSCSPSTSPSQILSLETRDPYPIAIVELFTDETVEHQEPELDVVRL